MGASYSKYKHMVQLFTSEMYAPIRNRLPVPISSDSVLIATKPKGTEIICTSARVKWHAVAQLVEALRCKPEGRGFDSLCFH